MKLSSYTQNQCRPILLALCPRKIPTGNVNGRKSVASLPGAFLMSCNDTAPPTQGQTLHHGQRASKRNLSPLLLRKKFYSFPLKNNSLLTVHLISQNHKNPTGEGFHTQTYLLGISKLGWIAATFLAVGGECRPSTMSDSASWASPWITAIPNRNRSANDCAL